MLFQNFKHLRRTDSTFPRRRDPFHKTVTNVCCTLAPSRIWLTGMIQGLHSSAKPTSTATFWEMGKDIGWPAASWKMCWWVFIPWVSCCRHEWWYYVGCSWWKWWSWIRSHQKCDTLCNHGLVVPLATNQWLILEYPHSHQRHMKRWASSLLVQNQHS